jgi:RNA polymerase sigma-70 factor (ECF subfamily)
MGDASQLFAAHRERVFRYLSRFVRSRDAAQDLTQEVFLRVSRGPIPSTTASGERAWVFTIAKNLALNYGRGKRLRTQVPVAESASQPTQELAIALQEAVACLSQGDRQVFLLREVIGLDYGEIAAMCQMTPVAVRSRVHRARLQLRARLGAPLTSSRVRNVRLGHQGRRT